ncbi:MAG TPA: hypothetical protein VM240_01200 [Verrucomicrobiae bacterium]|nr:hypothetical protein [Verrucomicrobiae bacterium]
MFRRAHIRLSLLVLASLLFQQVAMAAYACELVEAAPPPMPAGMEHCAQMDMAPVQAESLMLCEKHCVPDLTLLTDASAPSVPMLALPPAFSLVLTPPASHVTQQVGVPIVRSDPPPRLRYCSLLI